MWSASAAVDGMEAATVRTHQVSDSAALFNRRDLHTASSKRRRFTRFVSPLLSHLEVGIQGLRHGAPR